MMIYLLIAAAAYLIGSVNSAIVLVKLRFRQDVRTGGSGNAGATNAARTYGAGIGALTLGCDMLKAVLSCAIGKVLAGQTGLMLAGLFCLIGHCWPVFFHFKGGKGMAVAAGTLLVLDWKLLLVIIAFFAVVFLIWRRVSLSSVLSVLLFPLLYYLSVREVNSVLVIGTVMCLLALFQHRENIRRLFAGTEPKFQPRRRRNGK